MKAGIYYNKNYLTENKLYIDKIVPSLKKNNIDCLTVNNSSELDGLDILLYWVGTERY